MGTEVYAPTVPSDGYTSRQQNGRIQAEVDASSNVLGLPRCGSRYPVAVLWARDDDDFAPRVGLELNTRLRWWVRDRPVWSVMHGCNRIFTDAVPEIVVGVDPHKAAGWVSWAPEERERVNRLKVPEL